MASAIAPQLSEFALDVQEGLGRAGQKALSPRYFYDELGSTLFEAITLLPEYGLTRADERLLKSHAVDIASLTGPVESVAELGSGSGRKTRFVLEAFGTGVVYCPIDISAAALALCEKQVNDLSVVRAVCADWMNGLEQIAAERSGRQPLLLLFLGSSIGNLLREELPGFFAQIRAALKPGDFLLLGADLIKNIKTMLTAYDDPIGVTAAFNLNLLSRMNRELQGDFDLRSFSHEVRWNAAARRIEMHLLSCRDQTVFIRVLNRKFAFCAGETIWTESSHKFTTDELDAYAEASGFSSVRSWVDTDWAFAEVLWQRR
ncbi:MAG: egtD [Bryobacterales bacterium]|nr:egtD [Bryobacterales bacterium]